MRNISTWTTPIKSGKAVRSFGFTQIIIQDERFILTEGAASDLFRFRRTVPLDPVGVIHPERSGIIRITIPGKGQFFVNYKKLWGIINPKGRTDSTAIYELTGGRR